MNELNGKIAVITGASTPHGIGSAIAKRYAKAGASLYLVAEQTYSQLESLSGECSEINPQGQVEFEIVDLVDRDAPSAMIMNAKEKLGRVDILVNNAAMRAPYPFGEFTRQIFDDVMSLNIGAAFFASQTAASLMRQQGGGRIINIASQMGQVTNDRLSLYGLTKSALIHLSKSMAAELCKDGIIVNSLSPGPISTDPISDRATHTVNEAENFLKKERISQIGNSNNWNYDKVDRLPIGRLGTVEEIAEAAFFLATSPSFMIGHDLVVDGGYVLR